MCCENAIANASLETGPVQTVFAGVTPSGPASENAPLASFAGEADSAASPAVEVTFAVVDAVYVLATPGVNAPNDADPPSDSESVAGTVPPTVPGASVDAYTTACLYGVSTTGPIRPYACRGRAPTPESSVRRRLLSVVATRTTISFAPAFRYGPASAVALRWLIGTS